MAMWCWRECKFKKCEVEVTSFAVNRHKHVLDAPELAELVVEVVRAGAEVQVADVHLVTLGLLPTASAAPTAAAAATTAATAATAAAAFGRARARARS